MRFFAFILAIVGTPFAMVYGLLSPSQIILIGHSLEYH